MIIAEIATMLRPGEYFTWRSDDGLVTVWNVRLLRAWAEENTEMLRHDLPDPAITEEFFDEHYEGLDREYSMSEAVDPNAPMLVLDRPDGKCTILDGWHRLYKAWKLGRPFIPTLAVTEEQAKLFVVLEWKEGG